jgi:hypothetical protein
MTTLHTGLRIFRDQLRDAIQRDLDRRARRRRGTLRAARLGAAVLAVTAGLTAAVMVTGGAGPRPANAAILRAAAGALTPPPGTILHERAVVSSDVHAPLPIEFWAQADSPYAYRTIKFGRESSWDGVRYATYDPASNTISCDNSGCPWPIFTERLPAGAGPAPQLPVDFVATLRSLIQTGQARVEGTTVIDGVPAYELTVSGMAPGWTNGVANGTYDVAQSDYHPLLIQTTVDCATGACGETVRFQTYEFLPATSANLALLDLSAQHPGARVQSAAAATGGVTVALTAPPGTILHERAAVTISSQAPQPYELWALADSPYATRTIKFGREWSWDGARYATYDPASNTISCDKSGCPLPIFTERHPAGADPAPKLPVDLAATLRSLIQTGQARVEGTTVIDGVPAYELTVSGMAPGWTSGVANGTYDVAQSDYHPLLIQTRVSCSSGDCAETVRFQIYELLPATSANLALLDLSAQHPGARVQSVAPRSGG